MKKLQLIVLLFTCSFLLAACGGGNSSEDSKEESTDSSEESSPSDDLSGSEEDDDYQGTGMDEAGGLQLTDRHVKNYIALMEEIKTDNPEFNSENPLSNMAKVQTYLKKHGFKDITEFSMVNVKVAGATTYLIAEEQGLSEKAKNNYNEQLAELEKQLADDKIPAEAKAQIKETIKMLKENEKTVTLENIDEQINQTYGGLVTEEDMKIVKKNYPALKKVFEVKE